MTYIINNINIDYISRYYEESIDEQSEQNFIFRNTMPELIISGSTAICSKSARSYPAGFHGYPVYLTKVISS